MPNQIKVNKVEELSKIIKDSSSMYLTNYSGLDVAKITQLRRMLTKSSVRFIISKNTLTRIASKQAGLGDILDSSLKGQIGIAYSSHDPSAPARVIKEFKKENKELLDIEAIYFEGSVYGADKFNELANLPSKEELLAKFASSINQPMTKVAILLSSPMQKFVGALESLKQKK